MAHGHTRSGARRFASVMVLAALLVGSVAGTAIAADRWTDISDAQWVSTYGVTATQAATVADGYPDGSFQPSLSVTRGQFSKMAVKGLGLAEYDPVAPSFSDVAKGSTFFTFIEGAVADGVINGYPDGTFRPSNTISRQQANSILGRHLSNAEMVAQGTIKGQLSTYPTLLDWYEFEGEFYLGSFLDRNEIDPVHRPTTAYLIYHGVVVGSNQRLTPTSTLTRAQAVTMVLRTLAAAQDITTPPLPPTDMTTTPTSPSTERRPTVSGETNVSTGEVVFYDTFEGLTSELMRATLGVGDGGSFSKKVPAEKALVEGLHTLSAKVKDSHGRISDSSALLTYRVDLTAPIASIDQPLDDAAVSVAKPAFKAAVTDSGSGVASVVFQYAVDATTIAYQTISTDTEAPYEAVWPATGLPEDGAYLFRVIATDRAGNQTTSASAEVVLDRHAPDAEISYVEHEQEHDSVFFTADHTPDFVAEASDESTTATAPPSGVDHVAFYYALHSAVSDPSTTAGFTLISSYPVPEYAPETTAAAHWGTKSLPNGDYWFLVQSVDNAGNISAVDVQEVVVDDAPPAVTITAPLANAVLTGGNDFNITWTATDAKFAANPIRIDLTHDGATTNLTPANANGGTYTWAVPALDCTATVTITATDAMSQVTAVTSGVFYINTNPPVAPSSPNTSDPDHTFPNIDGRDFHATWVPSVSKDVVEQDVYILPTGTPISLSAHNPVGSIMNNTATEWQGGAGVTHDSAGNGFLTYSTYEVYIVAVDAAANKTASGAGDWFAEVPLPVDDLAGSDTDTSGSGVTGEDFHLTWDNSVSPDVIAQEIYILPAGATLHLTAAPLSTAAATINNNSTEAWTGPASLTLDAAGGALTAGSYDVYVVAVSDDGRKTSEKVTFTVAAP
jgi:hypothetical protein